MSDTLLLGFVNQTLKRVANLRPDLFSTIGDIATTADTTVQTMPSDSVRLVEIFSVTGGDAITEVSRETLDKVLPGWRAEASGTPVNFMRHPRSPNTYFLYPPPTSGTTVLAEYAQIPTEYGLNDTITAPSDAYFSVVVDGTTFLAASIDDEHVNSNRAKLFLDSFTQGLALSAGSRETTDDEYAGLDKEKVS